MDPENIKKAVDLIQQARLAKPLLTAALDAITNDFGPEIARALRSANDFLIGEKARSVKLLEQEGFTREEALLLTCDAEAARQRLLRQIAMSGPKAKPPVGSAPQPDPKASKAH
jgi:hypothetical protein